MAKAQTLYIYGKGETNIPASAALWLRCKFLQWEGCLLTWERSVGSFDWLTDWSHGRSPEIRLSVFIYSDRVLIIICIAEKNLSYRHEKKMEIPLLSTEAPHNASVGWREWVADAAAVDVLQVAWWWRQWYGYHQHQPADWHHTGELGQCPNSGDAPWCGQTCGVWGQTSQRLRGQGLHGVLWKETSQAFWSERAQIKDSLFHVDYRIV